MSVVGKSTCSGFKTGLYICYHGGNAVRYIKQRDYFLKYAWISGYFDTKYMTVLRIEQILHNFEDQKFAHFLYLEQVNFRVTLVIWCCVQWNVKLQLLCYLYDLSKVRLQPIYCSCGGRVLPRACFCMCSSHLIDGMIKISRSHNTYG